MKALFAFLCALAFAQDTQVCETEVSQHYCFDATCGVLLAEAALKDHLDCECTESHIGFDVTNCDEDTNTLSVYYFWKPPATCRGGMAYLRAPEHNIPCSTTCPAGQRYNVQSSVRRCEDCLAGQYSLAGGLSYDPPWTYLPPQFTSECMHTSSFGSSSTTCSPWRTMDNYLDSGDNWENPNTENILNFQIELVQDGRVEFEYKYDAEENFDIFSLYIDANRTFEARSPMLSWTTVSVPIGKGFHTLRWIYKKDGSLSKGADKAFIRSIQIFGVRRFDAECMMCPPGRFSDAAGSPACKPCPENTHSSSFGAKVCEPCHDWEKAFPGSATCSPRLPCTENDYFEFHTPCVDGSRNVSYRWIQPIKCETTSVTQGSEFVVGNGDSAVDFVKYATVEFLQPFLTVPNNITLEAVIPPWAVQQDHFELTAENITTTKFVLRVKRIDAPANTSGWGENLRVRWSARVQAGVELPANKTEPCVPEPCRAGQKRVDGVCSFCPVGRANDVPGGDCIECPRGEGAKQYVAYANWSKLTTGCTGDCGTPGWRFSGDFIDSGAGHGVGASSWFSDKLPRMPDRVEFDYLLSCPVDAGQLEVQIDQTVVHRIQCGGCSSTTKTAIVNISAAIFEGKETDFLLKIIFRKAALISFQHSCDVAKVYKLSVHSAKSGIGGFMGGDGAAGCSKCGVGRYSSAAECVDCAAGTYQDATGTDTCIACPAGKFAYRSATTQCMDCGFHTVANRNRTGCDGSCSMAVNSTNYDLAPLFQWQFAAMLESKDARFTYFLVMCDAGVPFECEKLKDDKWTDIPADVTQPRPLHVCISRMGKDESNLPVTQSINSGAVIGYDMLDAQRPRPANSTSPRTTNSRSGISVKIDKGATTLCLMSDLTPATQPLMTYVHFVCDPMGGTGNPEDVTPGNFPNTSALPPCVTHVEWVSANACPVCTAADHHFFDGPCVPDVEVTASGKGKSTRKYFWVEPKTCVGGVPLPPPNVTLGCDVLQAVGEHVVMSKGAVAALAVGGVLIALTGIAIVVLLFRKKRALERDNQNLRNYAQLAGDGKSKIPDVVELHTS